MLGTLFVVVESENQEDIDRVQDKLLNIRKDFSISPCRETYQVKTGVEFFSTVLLDEGEAHDILEQLNNDWDGDVDDCIAYGFNTKMFDDAVYYLSFQLYE